MEVKPVLFNYNTYCGYGVEFENYSKHKYIMIARAYFLRNNKKIALTSDKPLYVLRWLLGFPAKFHIHVLRCSHNKCCCRFQWNNFHDSCRMFLNTENEHFIFKYFHNLLLGLSSLIGQCYPLNRSLSKWKMHWFPYRNFIHPIVIYLVKS